MHPASFKSISKLRTVYLARPGVSALIEVHERSVAARSSLITQLKMPPHSSKKNLWSALGVSSLSDSSDGRVWMTMGERSPAHDICEFIASYEQAL